MSRRDRVWVFDLDNTLYPAASNLFGQIDQRMTAFVSSRLALPADQARVRQKDLYRRHGTTMRGLMAEHAVDPYDFMDYVHDIDVSVLTPAPDLGQALAALPGRRLVFTNGSTRHAENVLGRLGIADRFEAIFDIAAADFVPKPDPVPYARLVDRFAVDPARTVMVEDMPANLRPARALGFATVLVHPPEVAPISPDEAPWIDHRVSDLTGWLTTQAAAMGDFRMGV